MRRAFPRLLGKAARKGAAVHSASAPSAALFALLLVSPAAPAGDAGRSFQGPINLAQSYGDDALHCVSLSWGYKTQDADGMTHHQFFVTNRCSRAFLFNWHDNSEHCFTGNNNLEYPCAFLVRAGGRNVAIIRVWGGARIRYIATFQ